MIIIIFRFITTLWLLCAATGTGGKGQLLLLLSVPKGTVSSLSLSESARLKNSLQNEMTDEAAASRSSSPYGPKIDHFFCLFQWFCFYLLEHLTLIPQCSPHSFVCGCIILVCRFRVAVRPFSLSHFSVRSLLLRFLHTQHSSAVFHFLRRVTDWGCRSSAQVFETEDAESVRQSRPSVSASMTGSLRKNTRRVF